MKNPIGIFVGDSVTLLKSLTISTCTYICAFGTSYNQQIIEQ